MAANVSQAKPVRRLLKVLFLSKGRWIVSYRSARGHWALPKLKISCYYEYRLWLKGHLGPCSRKSGPVNLRRLGKPRQRYWVHALVGCLALTGEIHLLSVEVFHHHETYASIWTDARGGATHLHASQDISPFCPLCQILRSSSVRPATQTLLWKPHRETPYSLTTYEARYSLNLALALVARSPPLS